jgi:hypothetical protein
VFARRSRDKSGLPAALDSAKEAASRIKGRRSDAASTTVAPSTALLEQILDEYGLIHAFDDDGDLVVRWEKCSIYFFHYGEKDEVLQARVYLNSRYDVDTRPALILLLDDWNRTKLFPKGYTVLPDDGMVGVCAEQAYDFELGATREQIKYTVGSWIHTLLRFVDWIDEQV